MSKDKILHFLFHDYMTRLRIKTSVRGPLFIGAIMQAKTGTGLFSMHSTTLNKSTNEYYVLFNEQIRF